MDETGYTFTRDDFVQMLARKWYPERTDRESRVIGRYLAGHHQEFDRFTFGTRVGHGTPPNPDHLPAVQRATAFSTKKRMDILAWSGSRPTIIEVKSEVTPASLGQILTYRQLFLEEHPDAAEPALVVVGEESDPDTIAVLQSHGVSVFLYPPEAPAGRDATGVGGALGGATP